MRALTIKQPWAWAIIHGGKDIENRDWVTSYRGPLLIHAGADHLEYGNMPRGVQKPPETALIFSAMVGIVDLVDIVQDSRSEWVQGLYGWVLNNPRAFPKPVRCTGQARLWYPSPVIMRSLKKQLLQT